MIQDIKKFLWRLVVRLIYLTPIGHILSLLTFLAVQKKEGVNVQLSKYSPIRANIKENPTTTERINWFINGLAILFESYFLIAKGWIDVDFVGAIVFVSVISALVNMVAAIFPNAKFDKEFIPEKNPYIPGTKFHKSAVYAGLIIIGFIIIFTLVFKIIDK